jgi:hypothetical protein
LTCFFIAVVKDTALALYPLTVRLLAFKASGFPEIGKATAKTQAEAPAALVKPLGQAVCANAPEVSTKYPADAFTQDVCPA